MKKYIDKIKNIKIEDLTYFFWGIYLIICFLNMVGIIFINDKCQLILKAARYLCYLVFISKIIYDWKNGEKITISIISMAILSLAIAFFGKNNSIMFTILILTALRKLDFDKLIKIAFKIFATGFLIVVSLSLLKIIPNWIFNSREATSSRYALGFIYATDAFGMYLIIILMNFYIKKNNISIIELLLLQFINVLMYGYTNGRVSFILISALLLIQYLSRYSFFVNIFYKDIIQKGLKLLCHTLPIILFLLLHILIILYASNNFIANKVNDILSNRIKYTYQAYRDYDISLFGKDIEWNGWGAYGYKDTQVTEENFKYSFVDSSYASIVFDYGLILTCIVLLGYRRILINKLEEKNYWLVFTIIGVLIWSFIEQYIINLGKNIFVLTLIPLLDMGKINFLDYDNLKKCKKE